MWSDWLLIRANDRLFGIIGLFIPSRTFSILAMHSSSSSATHHIVLSPRLEVVVEQQLKTMLRFGFAADTR